MKCIRCKKPFRKGQHYVAHIVSVYQDLPNEQEAFLFSLNYPYVVRNFAHLYCSDEGEE